jgi:hypothetical protein
MWIHGVPPILALVQYYFEACDAGMCCRPSGELDRPSGSDRLSADSDRRSEVLLDEKDYSAGFNLEAGHHGIETSIDNHV